MYALINNIIKFSNVDGPGNRTAIFFQGCNYKCVYCHNPETINLCNNCGECVKICPSGALSFENRNVKFIKDNCVDCDLCIKKCPTFSSPKARLYSIQELIKELEKIKIFIQGITVSGGESTLNIGFITEFFKKVRAMGLSTFVDTNGEIDLSLEKHRDFINVSDKFMLDIKAWNAEEHKILTGKSNENVLKNFKFLLEQDKLFEVRTVINSMINSVETISETAEILKGYPGVRYKLITYRPFGTREEFQEKLLPLPSREELEKLRDIIEKIDRNIEVIIL